jgi:hypothetical protein
VRQDAPPILLDTTMMLKGCARTEPSEAVAKSRSGACRSGDSSRDAVGEASWRKS